MMVTRIAAATLAAAFILAPVGVQQAGATSARHKKASNGVKGRLLQFHPDDEPGTGTVGNPLLQFTVGNPLLEEILHGVKTTQTI